ncbi:OmpW family protein [Acidocella sp. KAb 2-4]|uniref:OmpW/AlkL family protein n=1 Tax=Acidocella sp. KAb 2-4 TaxID=2885158 RepID=UPI001D07DFFC|nr:OmpW family outer membrane protein [Acidocella sp. KAb 2-4]MCB5943168.1 outer membrane beta-barrel protein [Acidocella sp. KAb 2-4]
MKSSFRTLAAAALLSATAFTPALAQSYNLFSGPTGYQSGDILAHLSLIGVIPENVDSHVTGTPLKLGVTTGVSPELDASYFFTPNLSVQLIAATSRHTITAGAGGTNITLGSAWVLPPTLTAQWHFPQIGIVRPYVGVGVTVAFFYGVSSSAALAQANEKLGLRTAIGPSFDAGFDVPLAGNWTANVDVKQMILPVAARLGHGKLHAMTGLDPTVVGFGVGYKF